AAVVAANDAAATQWRIPMARLTDTQLVILSTASRRDDRGVDLPTNVTGEALRKAVDKLICTGLLDEVRAPMARSWPGDAMRKLDPWRFASPSRASKRSGSRMLLWALLQRQALARLPIGPKSKLCFPKIISERNGGAAQTRLRWLQLPRSVGLPDLETHPCPAPSACGPHCSTPRKKKEFVAGAPRRRPAPGPGTRDVRCQSDAPHTDFATESEARSVDRGCPSPSPGT